MSEQEQFEAWWNGDRPTDFTEYGASQWTKAHAYSAWLARASRPREACSIESHPAPGGGNAQVGGATERGAGIVPQPGSPLAPEARPVAEKPLAWTAFSESASWTGVWCKTREGAQERVDEFKRRWPKTGPYRVVPLYAHPASATAEGGDPWQDLRDDVLHNVDGYDNDTVNHYLGVIDYHSPATPASAAGREVAHGPGKCLSVDAIEFDRTVASREQDERERWIREDERAKCLHAAKHSPACKGCKRVMANAIRALLAAEAEGGWES